MRKISVRIGYAILKYAFDRVWVTLYERLTFANSGSIAVLANVRNSSERIPIYLSHFFSKRIIARQEPMNIRFLCSSYDKVLGRLINEMFNTRWRINSTVLQRCISNIYNLIVSGGLNNRITPELTKNVRPSLLGRIKSLLHLY